jgi:hypothetical protein
VDNVVVKTKNPDTLIEDLKQTFKNLKKWRWKLTQTSVYSEYHQDNYSDSWLVIEKSRPVPNKFEL